MQEIAAAVDKHRELILEAERYLWKHPETGYREVKSEAYIAEKFEKMGYNLVKAGDIPGFYTILDTGRSGPEVLILGELDSLICPNHKECDPETGYVHACGHHAQGAALLGVAAALKEPDILDKLCGRIRLCAVPAEELIEIEYRDGLIEKGTIKYYGGKGEFLRRGYFDGVDMAFMVHSGKEYGVSSGHVGCLAKRVSYKGVAAHAGGSPWLGKNALYAASQGLAAANAIRETFAEKDVIRFHPIITNGGQVVNAIPELVKMESFVRGMTFDAMLDANKRINQALIGAALSIGANIDIMDAHGYAPNVNDKNMILLSKEAADLIIPEENFKINEVFSSGSTDMGELSCIMPTVHPIAGGTTGTSHGDDYYIADPERACVKSAKMQMTMLVLLLQNNAERAKKILADFKPRFNSKDEYLAFVDSIGSKGDRIDYSDGDCVKVKL